MLFFARFQLEIPTFFNLLNANNRAFKREIREVYNAFQGQSKALPNRRKSRSCESQSNRSRKSNGSSYCRA